MFSIYFILHNIFLSFVDLLGLVMVNSCFSYPGAGSFMTLQFLVPLFGKLWLLLNKFNIMCALTDTILFFCFWILYSLMLFSGFVLVCSRNIVGSILALISIFTMAALFCIMLTAEFVGFALIIVYVGAIAVLFLFIVMMLDVNQQAVNSGNFFPFVCWVSLFFMFCGLSGLVFRGFAFTEFASTPPYFEWIDLVEEKSNIELFGGLLYTYYAVLLIGLGLILLVAMVAAITLALRVKRKNIT